MLDSLDRLIERVHRFARYGVWFGGILILVAAFVVGFDVAIRKLFNISLGGADEFAGFTLAIGSAWAFGFALLERAHVRIDSVYTTLPRPVGAVLDILGLTMFGIFMTLMAVQGSGVFMESVRNSTVTLSAIAWPLRYPQFLWVAGLWWFVVIVVLLWIRAVLTIVRGDFLRVQKQVGSKTVQEEVNEELAQLERKRAQKGAASEGPER
ncbi:MAG: TRAP transporter small permease [Alphaproteobacteria bacterium]